MSYTDYERCVPFALIIETDSYAGNFEREMHAWVTGHEGESYGYSACAMGEIARKEIPEQIYHGIADQVTWLPGDHGDHYVTIGGDECRSVIMYFDSLLDDDELKIVIDRIHTFPQAYIDNDQFVKSLIEIKSIKLFAYEVTVKEELKFSWDK